MGQVLGSDLDQLDGLGRAFADAAERLEALRAEVGCAVAFGPWQGVDADDSRSRWDGHLASAASALRERGGWLLVRAQQQRTAGGAAAFDVRPWSGGEWLAGGGRALLGLVAAGEYPFDVFDAVRSGHLGDRLHDTAKAVTRFAEEVVTTAVGTGDFPHGLVTDPASLETFDDGVGAAPAIAGTTLGVTGLVVAGTAGAPVVVGAGLVVGGVCLVWEHPIPREWEQDSHDDLTAAVGGRVTRMLEWDGGRPVHVVTGLTLHIGLLPVGSGRFPVSPSDRGTPLGDQAARFLDRHLVRGLAVQVRTATADRTASLAVAVDGDGAWFLSDSVTGEARGEPSSRDLAVARLVEPVGR
ncbi:hypothetical protein ACIGNX_06145 [Actinosynnema sp. NPDC053489]|uniref:hypothetical protein n=1 Tax=Actinosynnema sp. NPDC053489 TaxID=3363916 RepID=UPI0037C51EBD